LCHPPVEGSALLLRDAEDEGTRLARDIENRLAESSEPATRA
jgi:hypothetical protein